MAQCPNCHTEVKDDERFCGNCGTRLEPSLAPPPAGGEPRAPTGKETVVLPKITDLGMEPPPAPSQASSDATLVVPPTPSQPASDPTIMGGPPPVQPVPPQGGGGGYPGTNLPNTPAVPPPQQKSGSSVWKVLAIIAGIGVVACVALAIGAYLLLQQLGRQVSSSTGDVFATMGAGLETVAAAPSLEPLATLEAAVATAEPGGSELKPTPGAGTAGTVLYHDNFDDPQASDFTEEENESTNYKFVDGTYAITVKKPTLISWATMKGDYTDASIAVETAINGPAVSSGGLIFRYLDQNNFYIYTVDGEGRYGLEVYKDDKPTTLVEWTESPAIKPVGQKNSLRVETSGDTIRLYANDKLLEEISDNTIPHGKAALVVNTFDDPNVTIKFDNLIVQKLD